VGLKYEPRLDGLRAVAVSGVLLFHGHMLPGGLVGVDVFFVLSGWLITSLLVAEVERSGSVDALGFLGRRARRLFPALLLLVAVYLLLAPALIPNAAAWRWGDGALALAYLTNWTEAFATNYRPLSHTWSLGIEAQFYLAWPFVLVALLKFGRDSAAKILAVAWLVTTAARFGWAYFWPHSGMPYYSPLHSTGLLLGAVIALQPIRLLVRGVWPALGLLGVALFGRDTWAIALIPVAEIAAAMLILNPPAWLGWKPMVWLGTISYGVYLWHGPVLQAMLAQFGRANIFTLSGVTITVAAASYWLVERPFLKRPAERRSEDTVEADDRSRHEVAAATGLHLDGIDR